MRKQKKTSHLALQGGGAHGAFTWGVLDYLLEDGRVEVEGIAATSAGSMNAVVFAYGKMQAGVDGAREALHDFWYEISKSQGIIMHNFCPPFEHAMNRVNFMLSDMVTHLVSPYQFNPLNINYLKYVLENSVDFDRLKACNQAELFISATNVRTGSVKVFTNQELTIDVVLASAALPHLFHAVQIGKDYYWDGGYMGNPPIFPLFYHGKSSDVIIVHINPIIREDIPMSSQEIMNRINEITFNSSLLKEFRAIAFVNKLIEQDMLKDEFKDKFRHMKLHSIRADHALRDHEVSSKYDTNWPFLLYLRDLGRTEAKKWLKKNFKMIGEQSTVDLHKDFLDL